MLRSVLLLMVYFNEVRKCDFIYFLKEILKLKHMCRSFCILSSNINIYFNNNTKNDLSFLGIL